MSKSDEKRKSPVPTDILSQIFGKPEELDKGKSEAENVSLIIKEWLSPKHIREKTRLGKHQVLSVAILQSLASTYKIKTLDRFLTEYRTCKLSEDGQSSKELENILKSRLPELDDGHMRRISKFLE